MRTILCVDDDPGIVTYLEKLLQRKGYDVLTCNDPTRTGDILSESHVDLLILDVEMPEKSGLEVFDEVKKQYGEIPVLFATGYPDAFRLDTQEKVERWRGGFSDGLTDILYKPFSAEDVYEKVESLISLVDPTV